MQLKACNCGVLEGEECDCAAFALEAERVLCENPIYLRTYTAWPPPVTP